MEYLDFELRIASGSGLDYPVSVVRSPAGETSGTMRFPYDTLALDNQMLSLQNALLRSGSLRRKAVADVEETRGVVDFGQQLFQALFTPELQVAYRRSQDRARAENKGLRLRLRIEAPELSALPWEYMYDPTERDYVCLSTETPVVRYLEFDQPPVALTIKPPISLLVMIASPNDRPALDVARERQRIEVATAPLCKAGLMRIEWLEGSSWRHLQQALRRGTYHIFHFVGHGGFDSGSGEGVLLFTNDEGNASLIGATAVARLLADHPTLRLAVLNSCLGAKGSSTDAMSSTSAVLVGRGLPAVVAMQFEISDDAAIEFSRSLYEALADGMPIDAAVADARKAVSFSAPNSVEWGTPVLHMRSPDGVLFTIDGTTLSQARATGNYPRPTLPKIEDLAAAIPAPSAGPSAATFVSATAPPAGRSTASASAAAPNALGGGSKGQPPGAPPPGRAAPSAASTGGGSMRNLAIGGVVAAAVAAGAYFMLQPKPSGIGDVRLVLRSDTVSLETGKEQRLEYELLQSDRKTKVEDPAEELRESGGRIALVSDNPAVASMDSMHTEGIAVVGNAVGKANVWPVIIRANGDSAGSKVRTPVVVRRSSAMFEAAIKAFNGARDATRSDSVSAAALRAMVQRVDSLHGDVLRGAGGRAEDLAELLNGTKALVAAKARSDSMLADTNTTVQDKRSALQGYLAQVQSVRDGHSPTAAADSARLASLDAAPVGTVVGAAFCRGYPCEVAPQSEYPSTFTVGDRVGATIWFVRGSSGRAVFVWRRGGAAIRTQQQSADVRVDDGYRLKVYQDVRDAGDWELRVLNASGQLVFRHAFTVTAR